MNVTHFMIRAVGRKPWDDQGLWAALSTLDRLLNKLLQEGKLDLTDWPAKGQWITSVAVHCADPRTPAKGREAANQGFLREENPFEPGTRKHVTWNNDWDDVDMWMPGP
jgi:hypothetical protein